MTQYQQELGLIPDSYLYFDLRRNALFEGYSKDRLALGRPASAGQWKGRLFFAGEHTSLSATGLVHGAVESGKRAAIEVSDATTCGAPRVPKRVAVPYFESNVTSREDATYQRWKEIRREPDWKMGLKQGYSKWRGHDAVPSASHPSFFETCRLTLTIASRFDFLRIAWNARQGGVRGRRLHKG